MQADLVAGAVLLPLGALSVRAVREPRELLFAALPLFFAAHQLVEALVWAGADGRVSPGTAQLAAIAYVLFALPVLPTLLPLAVWLIETRERRRRVLPFLVLGLVVTAYMTLRIVQNGVSWTVHPHAIAYRVGLGEPVLWTLLYVVAVMGACLVSGYGAVRLFGVVNVVGLTLVGLAYQQAFASLWCLYAAMSSVLVLVHLTHRHAPVEEPTEPSASEVVS